MKIEMEGAMTTDQSPPNYVKPILVRYGKIAVLTASGSGMQSEVYGKNMCDSIPTKGQPFC